ncbi:murein biosynthesis integral membrane protein MurJ [Bacillus sp. V3B]|uniref:murein biosynthesis integral membrane protein MurJ n=1 Tax=Bacillus sp. V3B TaxID=2804915 RepID=UPI00210E701B|nr:murein biosynthesis integral membrane protein MurJ [Bacillus sp. V3B]MCQ6276842.1 murein biosynthesis integral membrane protein MurJ [Bacillus sp. V3B]
MFSKINKLPNIVKAVGIVTIISAIGKVLGFVREAIIAAYFGASEVADVFFVANIIPTLLYTAIGITIYSGIIPIYMEEKEKNQSKADETMSVLGTLFFLFALLITIIAFVFSDQLVQVVAPGFNQEQLELTSLLTRIMLPSICFFALTTIATGILNSHKKFVMPALTGSAQNIVVILSTVILAEHYGIVGLAIGVVLGAVFQFVIQYPGLSKYDTKFNFSFRKEKERIKGTLILFYPIIISSFAVQLNGVTDRIISSGLEEGSVSALNYASKLMQLPLSVLLAPLITVLYPSIVESAIKSMTSFIEIVIKGAKIIIYLSIPFIIVMMVCGQDLIELAFERGAFDRSATLKTVQIFVIYSLGLVFLALRDYLMNCLYALKAMKNAMYTSIFMVVTYIIFSILFSRYFQATGIALATTISSLLQTLLLGYFLWKQSRPEKRIIKTLLFDIGKYMITFAIVFLLSSPVYPFINELSNFITLVIMTFIVFSLFLLLSFLLKIKETNVLLQLMKRGEGT